LSNAFWVMLTGPFSGSCGLSLTDEGVKLIKGPSRRGESRRVRRRKV
jgi:hypothetical protein